MGSAMVGLALHGGALPIGGTFLVFLDYMRPPVRLAALSGARCVFVFSHDSVAVGEDGPTHQPVEHLATLRAVPGLHVIRPADANETAAAWADAVLNHGPTALVLSRQDVEVVTDGSAVCTGAATVVDRPSPQLVIGGTGAEVSLAVQAAERLHEGGVSARVVSMPSWDRFAPNHPRPSPLFYLRCPVLSVEAGQHLRVVRVGRQERGHRLLRCQRSRQHRPRAPRHLRRRGGRGGPPMDRSGAMTDLARLHSEFGQSIWLDNLSRAILVRGELDAWIARGVRGLTSNPTIFAKAIGGSDDYDGQFSGSSPMVWGPRTRTG